MTYGLWTENILVMSELTEGDLVGKDVVQEIDMFTTKYVQLPWLFHENICISS